MVRLACLAVPLFPLAARLRAEPELAREAVAVVEGQGPAARVMAATRPARRAGVRAGSTLAQARATLPGLAARGRDSEAERAAAEALLDVAGRFSPRVEDALPGLVFLEADGLGRRFPGSDGERDLGRALARAAREAGLPASPPPGSPRAWPPRARRARASPRSSPPGARRSSSRACRSRASPPRSRWARP